MSTWLFANRGPQGWTRSGEDADTTEPQRPADARTALHPLRFSLRRLRLAPLHQPAHAAHADRGPGVVRFTGRAAAPGGPLDLDRTVGLQPALRLPDETDQAALRRDD